MKLTNNGQGLKPKSSQKHEQLLRLAESYLKKNDFGINHTLRVLDIAKKNYNKYNLDESWKDNVFSLIILHDIGGSEIKDQYERGPIIAKELLGKLSYHNFDIKLITSFIARHHEKLKNPHDMFKILFDSDQLVKFSEEEFNHYNSKQNFDWNTIIGSFYLDELKDLAKRLLKDRCKK